MAFVMGLLVIAALVPGCGVGSNGGSGDEGGSDAPGAAASVRPEGSRPAVLHGRWDRVRVRGAGVPVRLGNEIITIAGGGYDGNWMLGHAFNLGSERSRSLPRVPLPWRWGYSVVSTGEQVIIWGGGIADPQGAAYDPNADAWRVIATSPLEIRSGHTAAWTGEEMVVWGGETGGDCGGPTPRRGAAYDPVSDSWRPIPNPPISGRYGHTVVWTGREMLIWGRHDAAWRRVRSEGPSSRWRGLRPSPGPLEADTPRSDRVDGGLARRLER